MAKDPDRGALLLPGLKDADWRVQAAAIRGLSRVRKKVVVASLVLLLGKAEGRIRGDCQRALESLTGEKHPSPDAWASWWSAVSAKFSFEKETEQTEPKERMRTVVRPKPPGDRGRTIYERIDSRNTLFVIDFSSSMQVKFQDSSGASRSRLDYVKQELISAIEAQLDKKDRFNLIAFSTKVRPWKKKLIKATSKNKKKARRWIRRLRPDGETNIYDTLEMAFKLKKVDTIYFLTDGNPTTGAVTINQDILGHVRKWNAGRGVRICTIGFLSGDGKLIGVSEDKGMSKRFLKQLAEQNGGSVTIFE